MNHNFLRATLAGIAAAGLGLAACEPISQPSTFTMSKWDDDGIVTGKEEVASVKFQDADGKPIEVSAAELNRGKTAFRIMCASCHGPKGDGLGPSAMGLVPPPRNFAAPGNELQFKFKSVPSGDLPTVEDLIRTVRGGLHGTAMLQWDVSEQRLREIINYIKTLSNRWQNEAPGKPIEISPDPVAAGKMTRDEAIKLGRWNYHSKTGPNCAGCHPAYVNQSEYEQLLKENGKETDKLRDNASWPVPKESEAYGVAITPPDFTFHELRSITQIDPLATAEEQAKQRATRLTDLYRAIGTGIGGTAMPTWKGVLKEEDLWGLVHFVETMIEIKSDSAKRSELIKKLRAK